MEQEAVSGVLGAYRLESRIGSGGMGVVYRARDTRLPRHVAIKLLPESFAGDSARIGQFKREAEVLAALNHPHIATIYGYEEDATRWGLVMELIEGPTLAERIKDGPLPQARALEIARQVAEALEQAHERGVVHRDLKPSNIKLTAEGTVKVLDFGLASMRRPPAIDESAVPHDDATFVSQAGVIAGTAPYMSPEQARGQRVDARTDIWAFGAVLYEMLTGVQAFGGPTVADALGAVLTRDPDWDALPASTPPSIRRLLERCLTKDLRRRLPHIGSARLEIEDALTETALSARGVPANAPRSFWRRAVLVAGAATAGAILAALALWPRSTPEAPDAPIRRFAMAVEPLATIGVLGRAVALSPDGQQLVYVGRREGSLQLYLHNLSQLEGAPIEGTRGASQPFFSPDGEWIGYVAGGRLWRVSTAGGPAVTICDVDGIATGATWAPDGSIVFGRRGEGLFRVQANGGTPAALTTLDAASGELGHWNPEVLPDGRAVILTVWTGSEATLAVQSLDSGERRALVEGNAARYVPSGHLVFIRAGVLWAAPFDLDRLELTAEPAPVVEGILDVTGSVVQDAHVALDRRGSLVYLPAASVTNEARLAQLDATGREVGSIGTTSTFRRPRLSPDGTLLAVDDHAAGEDHDVWVYDVARGARTRLTSDGHNAAPLWTPDGLRIAYESTADGPRNLYWRLADGSGPAERLQQAEYPQYPTSWSPDGRLLFYTEEHPVTGRDIWTLALDEARARTPLSTSGFDEHSATISPDGRSLAYVSNESGREEVYVQPFPEPGRRWLVSIEGGRDPVWSDSGDALYFWNDNWLMRADVDASDPLRLSRPERMFPGSYLHDVLREQTYDLTADGNVLLVTSMRAGAQPSAQLVYVERWAQELTERFAAVP